MRAWIRAHERVFVRWSNTFLVVCVVVALFLAGFALLRTTQNNARLLVLEHARIVQAQRALTDERTQRNALAEQQARIDGILDGKISLNSAALGTQGQSLAQAEQQIAVLQKRLAEVAAAAGRPGPMGPKGDPGQSIVGPRGATGATGSTGPPGPCSGRCK